uniref:T cell surface glycoprotein CD8 alpha chain n=1 Tax=Lutjanus sanguineus TaxID=264213 RepID=A0A0A7CEE8_9TELE|nr:T cell surface glycoprotein CD8 alpha chain [Lutjanus sanguineus]
MDKKWIHILVILVFYQKIHSGAGEEKTVKEGEQVEIKCEPGKKGTLIVWFRVLDTSGMEFIGSYSTSGMRKPNIGAPSPSFSETKIAQHTLILKSFNKDKDVGIYSCASLIRGVELKFGQITRLVGEKVVVAPLVPTISTQLITKCTTATPCVCDSNNNQEEPGLSMFCTPIIMGPLVGGCGLLLLLLIIATVYCHKIRTRRCPHHYKRQPRTMPAGKQKNNRPV